MKKENVLALLLTLPPSGNLPYSFELPVSNAVIAVMEVYRCAAMTRYILNLLKIVELISRVQNDSMLLCESAAYRAFREPLYFRKPMINAAYLHPGITHHKSLTFVHDSREDSQCVFEFQTNLIVCSVHEDV